MVVFASVFPRLFDPERREARAAATPTPRPTPTPPPVNARSMTGLVTNISGNHISLMDISNNQARHFGFQDTTELADRFGREKLLEDLSVGNLMEISYDPDTNNLFTLRQSVTRDLTPVDFHVDAYYSTITVGNEVFNFTPQTLVLRRGVAFNISDITSDDLVTLVTLDGYVWTIDVEASNGFLEFTNASSIAEGRVILNPIGPGINRFGNLDERIILPEGSYRVTVEGRNIEPYTTEITITYSQTTVIDLAEVSPSAAVLELTITPAGSRVYINGELTSAHSAIEFEFGEQVTIRVEREGYYTETRTIAMDLDVVSINIALEEETPVVLVGNLTINTVPIAAQIWVNGVFAGFSPVTLELEVGTADIVAIAMGYYDYTTSTTIAPGENSRSLIMQRLPEELPPIDDPWTPPPYDPHPPYDPPDDYGDYGDGY